MLLHIHFHSRKIMKKFGYYGQDKINLTNLKTHVGEHLPKSRSPTSSDSGFVDGGNGAKKEFVSMQSHECINQ